MHAQKTTRKKTRSKRTRRTTPVTSRRARTLARREPPPPVQAVALAETPPPPQVACLLATAPAPTPPRVPWTTRAQTVVLVVICILVAGMLVAARRSSEPAVAAANGVQPHVETQVLDVALAPQLETHETRASAPVPAAPPEMPKASARKSNTPARAAGKASMEGPAPEMPAAAPAAKVLPAETVAKTSSDESTAVAHAESNVKADVEVDGRTAVTISGCLEASVSDDTFRLTGTDGSDAPKSRSWKSGFLKRRPAPVELIDSANALRLRAYVGQRITATGLLMNREMQVRSLRAAGSSCE